MSRAVMRKYAPGARALGVAELADHRFVITADGYASVEPARARTVHGVLWRITPRDRVMLDAWENVGGGLYRAETLAVRGAGGRVAGAGLFRAAGAGRGGRSPAISSWWSRRRGNGICRKPISVRWKRWRAARPLGAGRAQDRRIPVT